MAKTFLEFYVTINIIIVLYSLAVSIFSGSTYHILSDSDWLTFIVACGALAIVETYEEHKKDQ